MWHQILEDCAKGELKRIYQATEDYSLSDFPIPKRDISSRDVYKWDAHLVLTTRGCSVKCGGCPIPNKEGTNVRLRPVNNIIEDIKSMPYKEFYFADDTVMLPVKIHQFPSENNGENRGTGCENLSGFNHDDES